MRLFDRIFRVPFFRPEFGVDVASLPVKELMAKKGEDKVKKNQKIHLVAILGGDLPCVRGRLNSQLAEEGERVRDVDLGYVP